MSAAKPGTALPWILGQRARDGYRYFTGRPGSWTADLRKAARLSGPEIYNIQKHVSAFTWDEPITALVHVVSDVRILRIKRGAAVEGLDLPGESA